MRSGIKCGDISLEKYTKIYYNSLEKSEFGEVLIMKKVLFLAMLLCSVLFLSSCEVHYFGSNYDVPWYIIAIPVALFSFVVLFTAHISIIKKYYKCPKCGTEFKPKWYTLSSWIHENDKRVMRCPKCGRKGFCKDIDSK